MKIRVAIAMTFALAGCGGGDGGDGSPPDAGLPRAVTGSRLIQRITGTGVVTTPVNLSTAEIAALVPDGQGGFAIHPGTGTAEGTFSIPDVPAGRYYLKYRPSPQSIPSFVVTEASEIDLGDAFLGRGNRTYPGDATSQPFRLDGLEPWQAGDILELFASNTSAYIYDLHNYATGGAPGAGATSVDLSVDWVAANAPLLDAGFGDRAMLFQLSTRSAGGTAYQALTRAGEVTDLVQDLGGNPTVTSALMPVAQTPLSIQWRRSAFEALRGAVNPAAETTVEFFVVGALPQAYAHGAQMAGSGFPDLLVVAPGPPAGDLDLSLGFGNPFPQSWEVFAYASHRLQVPVLAQGAASPASVDVGVERLDRLATAQSGPVEPGVGPVTNLRVDGRDAFQPQAETPVRPVVTWEAPSVGTATGFTVQVIRISADQGTTTTALVAFIHTTETSVTIPLDVIAPGDQYLIEVIAIANVERDLAHRPFESPIPASGDARAFTVSSLMTAGSL